MSKTPAPGLMAFWADIDDDYILSYQEWHNCEHVPERLSVPGFRHGRRFRGLGTAPMFLMSYETDSIDVFASEAYLARVNHPTPWTREALTHFRNASRNLLAQIAAVGAPGLLPSPYLHVERFNLPETQEPALLAWLIDTILPRLSRLAAVQRARLYQVDEAIANLGTSERKIYGGGPGQQKFVLWVETNARQLATDPGWDGLLGGGGDGAMLSGLIDRYSEDNWLEFALRAPMPG